MDNFSRKAKFEDIKHDIEAVKFHAIRYDTGQRDKLSLACYQFIQQAKMKGHHIDLNA